MTLSAQQRRVLSAIALCRTSALGGHLEECPRCGLKQPAYNSCRNRHCPKCQALQQEQWIAARSERILPTPHFHVVFTLPSELRGLARYQPKLVYDAFFHATADTLLQLGRARSGAELGVTLVLHTWTRELRHHPHLHAIVTCGGLALDDTRWVPGSRKYLFPVAAMSKLLRAKMMASLGRMHTKGHLDDFDDFRDPEGFDRFMRRLASVDWVTYAKRPFRRVDHVVRYLGRYTHRVAISNSRLIHVTDQVVTFRTRNGKTASVHPVEFLARFVQHVLPAGFVKIRHYGLYAGSRVHTKLAHARELLRPPSSQHADTPAQPQGSWIDRLRVLTGRDARLCPRCGDELLRTTVLPPTARAPPRRPDLDRTPTAA